MAGLTDSLGALLGLPYTDVVVLLGAVVLGVTSGVLGAFAVLRRRSLVGDAISHSTLPGVCLAFLLAGAKDVPGLLVGAAIAGLAAAVLMVGAERLGLPADTAIGVVLSGFFCLGIVLLTYIAGSGNADQAGLGNYLFGQAAGLLISDVAVMAGIGAVALATVVVGRRALTATLFDPAHAAALGLRVRLVEIGMTVLLVVAVVIGVRLVGAILMVAMLVVPTVVARQFVNRLHQVLVLAGAAGAVVGAVGALAATRAQLPTGPVVVLVGVTLALVAVAFAPGRGAIWQAQALARRRRRSRDEALLSDPHAPDRSLMDRYRRTTLRRRGLLADDGSTLTPRGRQQVEDLSERRSLWSAWLAHGWRLDLPDAREPDPHDLAGSLGPQALDQLRRLAATAGGTR